MHIPVRRYLALLAVYLKPQWRSVLLLAFTLTLSVGLQLSGPQILGFFIATAEHNGSTDLLIGTGIVYALVALATQSITVANTYLSTNMAWSATNRLRTDLVAHCLSLDMSFHKARTTGEMIERIDGDVNALSNFFSQLVINLLTSMVLLVGILALFYWIDWRIGIAMTLFSLIVLFVLMFLRQRALQRQKETRQMNAQFYGFLSEHLTGTEDMRANGATGYVLHRFSLLLRTWFPIFYRAQSAGATLGIVSLLLFVCGTALALGIGTYQWTQGTLQISAIYMLFAYTNLLSEPIHQIQAQLYDLQQAEASIQRIEDLFATRPALSDGQKTLELARAPSIDFSHVLFGYKKENPVIQGISFRLEAGRVLGILGRTGSGKSTLARLLFRLYDPQAGEICLDDVPLHTAQLRTIRRHIALVTQDVQIFHTSIRNNLTIFNSTIPDTRILQALEDVGLHNWYRSLPDGLDMVIGSTGKGLSTGEAQLLAFARAFLQEPQVVILDEASSRLDPTTEQHIEQAIDKLLKDRTALVIAHRLATIKHADDILIIEDGQCIEHGAREKLQSDPTSRFSQLLRTGLEEIRT